MDIKVKIQRHDGTTGVEVDVITKMERVSTEDVCTRHQPGATTDD